MVHGKNRIPYWIDRRLNGLAGPEFHGRTLRPWWEQQGEWLRLSDGPLAACPTGSPASSGPSSGLVAGLAVRGASTVCWRLSLQLYAGRRLGSSLHHPGQVLQRVF